MSWVEKVPRPWDFCGCTGCPICYDWGEGFSIGPRASGNVMSALERMSLDLTGKFLDELTPEERAQLQGAADKIHARNLAPLEELPVADIGMSDARHMEGWLAENKAPAANKAPQLTLDQRDDWQKPVEAEAKRKEEMAKRKSPSVVAWDIKISDMVAALVDNPYAYSNPYTEFMKVSQGSIDEQLQKAIKASISAGFIKAPEIVTTPSEKKP